MNVKYVHGICRRLNDWVNTARVGYDFNDPDINQLKSETEKEPPDERAYRAYLKWTMIEGHLSVTAVMMLHVLHKAGEKVAIDYLMKKLQSLEQVEVQ